MGRKKAKKEKKEKEKKKMPMCCRGHPPCEDKTQLIVDTSGRLDEMEQRALLLTDAFCV
jgi:hypothetical protein